MTIWESARIAVRGLRAGPLRSLLTMLGIIIGVAAVIVLVAFGNGLQRFVADAFGPLANQIQITPDRGGISGSIVCRAEMGRFSVVLATRPEHRYIRGVGNVGVYPALIKLHVPPIITH